MNYLNLLIERYENLAPCRDSIQKAYNILEECFSQGHKLLVAGNGGSCADSEHIVG
ncbi:MAG: SIS domain-containing protein, partial [Clostridia bacterium]|nr:SIS domain-containing protein [Clostridia bacterium]